MRLLCIVSGFVVASFTAFANGTDKRLQEVLKRGREFLKRLQCDDGSFNLMPKSPIYLEGCTALVLWSLAAAGEPPDSPAFVNGFKYLLSRYGKSERPDFKFTYNAACIIEAVVAYAARANPQLMQKHKRINKRLLLAWRALPVEYQFLARKAALWLVETQLPNGAWTYSGTRTKTPQTERDSSFSGGDISNTEFAVNALYTIARVGVPVPEYAFRKAAEWLIENQCKRGAAVSPFRIPIADTSYKTLRRFESRMWKKYEKEGRESALRIFAEAWTGRPAKRMRRRGWGYRGPGPEGKRFGPTGSRTSGAVASLIACKIRLEMTEWYRKNGDKLNTAIRDGFAYILRNLRFTSDPGQSSTYYRIHWLFSLQRACRMALLERIGKCHWFRQMKRRLERMQLRNGSWPADKGLNHALNTCFALLALSKATYPPVLFKLPPKKEKKR